MAPCSSEVVVELGSGAQKWSSEVVVAAAPCSSEVVAAPCCCCCSPHGVRV